MDLIKSSSDTGRNTGLNSLLDDSSGRSFDELVKQIVLGVPDGEGKGVTVSVDMVDLEDPVSATSNNFKLDIDRDTLASNDNLEQVSQSSSP